VTTDYRKELTTLLNVTPAELRRRADTLFRVESGVDYPVPLVLCGAGRLGRIVLAGLRNTSAEVLAFADNDPRRHPETIDGCPILSVRDAADRYGGRAVFVITVYTAAPLREQIASLGLRVASSRALFFQHRDAFPKHASVAPPESIPAQADEILRGVDLWADDASRSEYMAQIAWHLLARRTTPPWTPPDQTYFPDGLVTLGSREVFVDCGAFDGDSVRAFIARTGGQFERILAFEPDPANYELLTAFIAGLPEAQRHRVDAAQVAVHSKPQILRFESASGAGSNISRGGDIEVHADRLDSLLDGANPTFLKMDIEGAEPDALEGATGTLRESAPTLAICLYHERQHLWQLPTLIRQANPDYQLFLRRHSDESWETVCYGIPQH
jgi:FkbM family methyltransferase